MADDRKHLSDEELLRFSDQELVASTASSARQHLAGCEMCSERLKDFDSASTAFADFYEREIQVRKTYSSAPRKLLKARLSESSRWTDWTKPPIFRGALAQQIASSCLAILLVVAGIWSVRDIERARSHRDATKTVAVELPRRTLTPGSTHAVQIRDLCSNMGISNDPPVTSSVERAVLKEYGVPNTLKMDYELDYLITPSLGGADNIQNLWPQPNSARWNARAKDQLENHLHELVCRGQVPLTTAQNDIASDWIAAYKRYFNTDKPLVSPSQGSSVARPRRELHPGVGHEVPFQLDVRGRTLPHRGNYRYGDTL